eukprot:286554_1
MVIPRGDSLRDVASLGGVNGVVPLRCQDPSVVFGVDFLPTFLQAENICVVGLELLEDTTFPEVEVQELRWAEWVELRHGVLAGTEGVVEDVVADDTEVVTLEA